MRIGTAAGLLLAGLAVTAAIFAVRTIVEPGDAVVGEPAASVEPVQTDTATEQPAKAEDDAATGRTAAPSPGTEPVGEAPRSAAVTAADPAPSADLAPPAGTPPPPSGTLRDPRALIASEAPGRDAATVANSRPESGSPVANDSDTSLGGLVQELVDRRPLTISTGAARAPEGSTTDPAVARREAASTLLQDARALAPAAPKPAAEPGGSPERTDARLTTAAPDPFRDNRALAKSAGQEASALQDARDLVPINRDAATPRDLVLSPDAQTTALPRGTARPDDRPAAALTQPSVAQPAAAFVKGTACGPPTIATTALDSGRMQLLLTSECRANQDVQLAYGGAVLIRRLDAAGRMELTLDAFAGTTTALEITMADGRRESVPVVAKDLERLTKVAVIWRAPVNLDLHAFEYAAPFGRAGHVWERTPMTQVIAQEVTRASRKGRGFLSSADDGRSVGDKLEVYTFLHHDEQASGAVGLSVDYETRGELPSGATCGTGAYAEVAYQFSILNRSGQLTRESGVLAAAPCGVRVAPEARFDPLHLPALRVRK